jgi:hypothetical protein
MNKEVKQRNCKINTFRILFATLMSPLVIRKNGPDLLGPHLFVPSLTSRI